MVLGGLLTKGVITEHAKLAIGECNPSPFQPKLYLLNLRECSLSKFSTQCGHFNEGSDLLFAPIPWKLLFRCILVTLFSVLGPLSDGRFMPVRVDSIHRNKAPCRVVRAGLSASLSLNQEVPGLRSGMVLVSYDPEAEQQPSGCLFFQVRSFTSLSRIKVVLIKPLLFGNLKSYFAL